MALLVCDTHKRLECESLNPEAISHRVICGEVLKDRSFEDSIDEWHGESEASCHRAFPQGRMSCQPDKGRVTSGAASGVGQGRIQAQRIDGHCRHHLLQMGASQSIVA